MTPIEGLRLPEPLQSPWVQGIVVFVLWMIVFLLVKKVVLGAMHRMAARTRWTWDDVLVQALSQPLLIAIAASGLLVSGRVLPLSPEWDRAFDVLLAFAVALALVLFVDRACRALLDRVSERSAALAGARGLIQGIVRGVIIGLGLLIFLDSIGISITPLLASLGVGSLAVALALQETLANLFAGLYMIVDKPIEAGQFIRLESGEEGSVVHLGWRSTRIQTLAGSLVVVPNSKLAGSVITNYSLPQPELSVHVDVGVHLASDLQRVEQVTLAVAREVQKTVTGAVAGFEPSFRFQAIGESRIVSTATLRAQDFVAGSVVKHEFMKRLIARYRQEGIVIPFPTRTLDLQEGRWPAPPGN
ncbi:MAG TPA: mechanosensitive ion channel family protein [Candidatus Polarisedimenticolia bacterium]|nr:mechanosensitive ion channel family protein [Candidatus Polarisedimenticolia bacterium]